MANRSNAVNAPVSNTDVTHIREGLLLIAKDIERAKPILSDQLMSIKDNLFIEVRQNWVVAYILMHKIDEAVLYSKIIEPSNV